MTKIKTKTKNKRKLTKKNNNKLKGGCKNENRHKRILRLIKFIASLDQNLPAELNLTQYGTNYPFKITYFDLKIISLYITLLELKDKSYNDKNLGAILTTFRDMNKGYINTKDLEKIYELINELCFGDQTVVNKLRINETKKLNNNETKKNQSYMKPKDKPQFNFYFYNDLLNNNSLFNESEEYSALKNYLMSNFLKIYYLFYKKMIENTMKNSNSGIYINNNNTIGIPKSNNANTYNFNNFKNRNTIKPYKLFQRHFFNKYKKIFSSNGEIKETDDTKLKILIENILYTISNKD